MFAISILIFDSYGMKSLYLKFGHPCQIFWSWVYCIALNWQHDDIDIDATSNSKRTYVQLDSFDLWSQQSYFRQESEMGRTYHRTPFKSCTSLYSPEAKMGSQKVTRKKKKTIYSARWPLSLPSVFLSSKIPKVDVSFQYNESLFFTDNPLELIWDDLNSPADILLRRVSDRSSVNISLLGPKKEGQKPWKLSLC